MSGYRVWLGDGWGEVPVPEMDGEAVVVPNVAALVYPDLRRDRILLQRRDKPGEPVRGLLEVPGGRWRPGEAPDVAVVREVEEETGLKVTAVAAAGEHHRGEGPGAYGVARPLAVVTGLDGAYPALHVLFECYARGTPRPLAGETRDPRWWPRGEVEELVRTEPEAFVGHTRAMLLATLER
jgi:8-oxo-dGTP diphosphatase